MSPGHPDGWYPNRYGWCAYGHYTVPGYDAGTGMQLAQFDMDFVILGFGNNGARQFDYLVYLENIKTEGVGINWDLAIVGASFTGCIAGVDCPVTSRYSPIPAWRASNTFAVTFTSPDIAGAGEQRVEPTMGIQLSFATPTQPEWVWGSGLTVARAPNRYDSATYVGRARGAVFTAYQLVFTLDVRLADQTESARHIMAALEQPRLTFPSWLGKTVPGEASEPLTRMYNDADRDKNQNKSRTMCDQLFGTWNGDLQNCDEFPFASTYEGSFTGPRDHNWGERYSVRLIDMNDNQHVGRDLLGTNFYQALRVLDGDRFSVQILR